jgi:hypothetical protein
VEVSLSNTEGSQGLYPPGTPPANARRKEQSQHPIPTRKKVPHAELLLCPPFGYRASAEDGFPSLSRHTFATTGSNSS